MRTNYFLTAALAVAVTLSEAQRPGGYGGGAPGITGSVSGEVTDAQTAAPVEFATLLLLRVLGDSTAQVDGVITDERGRFVFEEVPLGTYRVEASFIGYEVARREGVTLTGKRPDVTLERIELGSSAAALEAVVVTGEAELIENRVDKVVYNASQDVASLGGDGADVLRRVPLLSVDLDGNVQLRGSSQVQILINGRPSTMFAGSVGEALQAMPAEEIEKVEVITSPGARYQGEGTAGIINIITKRGGLKGLTGSVGGSIGTRSNNARLNLAYTKGRAGANAGFGSRFSWPRPTVQTFERVTVEDDGSTTTLSQNGEGQGAWLGLNGSVGAFYDFNAFNSLNTSLRVNGRRRANEVTQLTQTANPAAGVLQAFDLFRDTRNPGINYDWTTDFKRKFDGEDHELNLAFQLGASTRSTEYEQLITPRVGAPRQNDELGDNRGLNLEYIFQADYQVPLSKKTFFETGAQAIIRDLESDFQFFGRPNSEVDYALIERRSNVFAYDQDVYAGYASLRQTFSEKFSAVAGVRYEGTGIGGALERADTIPSFTFDYFNWLPSASLQYKLSQSSSVRVAYTRRIQRPGLRDINPFIDESNPVDISFGNPELLPEVTDQFEITTNGRLGPGFLNASVFYQRTDDLISEILEVEDGVSQTFPINLGQTDAYGANLFANYTIAKVIKLRGGVNVERLGLVGAGELAGLSRDVWQYSLNGSATVELPRDIVVESFGFYRAPTQTLQGERASFSIWSIGAQKKLADDKWRLGVRIVEPFARDKSFPNELSGEGFVQRSEFTVLFRSFGLTANYKFGELSGNRPRERRTKINANDQRSEGGGEF